MRQTNFKYRKEALGKRQCDCVLRHCRLVNVLSARIEEDVSIAIAGHQIVGIGDEYHGEVELDLEGAYVYPGLIDAHIHLESTKMTIPEVAKVLARYGTSTVITDPHEIANVASLDGLAYQLDTASDNGYLNVYFTAPSCVPALADEAVETFGSHLGPSKLDLFAASPWIVSLGEVMNIPGVLGGDSKVLRKIKHFRQRNMVIDGHAPLLSDQQLNAYIYMGVETDHESTELAEAQQKLDRGMFVMIREGSTERNMNDLLPLITPLNSHRLAFVSDDIEPIDLAQRGHLNAVLRRAVEAGIDPIMALQMVTINPAQFYGLDRHIGAIFPGANADLVVSKDLVNFSPQRVMHHGKWVIENDQILPSGRKTQRFLKPSINVKLPKVADLAIKAQPGRLCTAISIVPEQILTNRICFKPKVVNGIVETSTSQNIAKVVVFERHRGTGAFGVGYVHGFGLKRGAFGSSVSHDSHNIIVIGRTDEEILAVANRIASLGGGQVALANGKFAQFALPIAGLMSDEPFEHVVESERHIDLFCHQKLGIEIERPMGAMSFMALPVIPMLRITDQGLFSIAPGGYPEKISLWCDQTPETSS